MATMAEDFSERRTEKAPISAHPAFPAIVALWFAALLGLGSLVLPLALLERLIAVTRVASLVPAAEPPLGFTARVGLALGASIAGAVVGLLLARKIANASAPERRGRDLRIGVDRECRPISAHDELGEDALDSPDAAPSLLRKRRSPAAAENNRPGVYLQTVPLPGQADDWSDAPASDETPPATDEDKPLELGVFGAMGEDRNEDLRESRRKNGFAEPAHRPRIRNAATTGDSPMSDQNFRRPAAADEDDGETQEFQPSSQAFEPEPEDADPLPFAAPSLRRSPTGTFEEDEETEASPARGIEGQEHKDAIAPELAPQLTVVDTDGEPDNNTRPLEELGLVQLAARLGASIEKRRAWLAERQSGAAAVPQAIAPFSETEDFETARPEDAARAIADFFGPASASTEIDLAVESERAEYDEMAADKGEYSSLLAMKNPFVRQQDFVRVDEPEDDGGSFEPAVTFPAPPTASPASIGKQGRAAAAQPFDSPKNPGESGPRPAVTAAPRDPDEAERRLRDALATLQRTSGAA
jgi:hypothetical protein